MIELKAILKAVSDHFGINPNVLSNKTRKGNLPYIRHVFFYIAFTETDETLYNIGSIIGRHHSTVLHGISKIDAEKKLYRDVDEDVKQILNRHLTYRMLVPDDVDLVKMCMKPQATRKSTTDKDNGCFCGVFKF